jgi:hypothetical protein
MNRHSSSSNGGGAGGISGRQLRKERRKEERSSIKQEKKLKKLENQPKVASVKEIAFEGHDSTIRSQKRRLELYITALKKSIEKEQSRLQEFIPLHVQQKLEEERQKLKLQPKLRGAARPAWEVYPELYPELQKKEEPIETVDLIKKHSPNCFSYDETRNIIGLHFQLAHALLTDDTSKSRSKESQTNFRTCLELDKSDPFRAKLGYFIASLDRGEIMEGWESVLGDCKEGKMDDDTMQDIELAYHSVLACFLEWSEMDDSSKKVNYRALLEKAVKSCPEIAFALTKHELFSVAVDPAQILAWIREERELRVTSATSSGISDTAVARCDSGACLTKKAFAVSFFACFAQYWVSLPLLLSDIQNLLISSAPEMERLEDTDFNEHDVLESSLLSEESGDGQAHDAGWWDKTLGRMFDEVALKFS